MLRHCRVEVVLYHQHDGCSLAATRRVSVHGPSAHRFAGQEPVHVDPAVGAEFLGEFRGEDRVVLGREIPQGIVQSQFPFRHCQHGLPYGCMADPWRRLPRWWQGTLQATRDFLFE